MDPTLRTKDQQDLAAFVAGSNGHFRLLYDRHFRELGRLAYGVLLDSAEAKDVVQEVFVRLHREARSLRPDTDLRGWLCRVTLNVSLSWRRTLSAWSRRTLLPSRPPSPSEVLATQRASAQLAAALAALPARQRAVLALHLDAELTSVEIATTLGITANAARVNLHRAITTLRGVLGREQVDLPFDDVVLDGQQE